MNISKIRKALYTTAKALGDVQAVQNNKVPERIARRAAGKATGKLLKSIFK